MAIPILKNWKNYFGNYDEGLGSSYERIVLNKKLEIICKHFRVKSVLEAPSFGFTGISGINSMHLAKKGVSVNLIDHDFERVKLISDFWSSLKIELNINHLASYNSLPFNDNSIDFSWNFSALWFVNDLTKFLTELSRVTSKIIMLTVPNRTGIGYLSQKFLNKEELQTQLKEENIIPENFIPIMKDMHWELIDANYIDCPPWPDIGMPKERFLKIFGLSGLLSSKSQEPITIADYYSGKDRNFDKKMMSYYWFENCVPDFIKYFWAHHKFYLFLKK